MRKRIISSLILIAIVFLAISYGKGFSVAVIFTILATLGLYEIATILKQFNIGLNKNALHLSNLAIMASAMTAPFLLKNTPAALPSCVFLLCSFAFALSIMKSPFDRKLQQSTIASIISLGAISFSLMWLVLLSSMYQNGFAFAIWIVAVTKLTDIGGYAIGVSCGRHKIAPQISPGKSVEGLVGGLLSSAIMGAFFVVYFADYMPENFTKLHAALWAVLLGFLGLLSDLLESVFKRNANVKDSGNVIPGIGGALDLLDSLVISAPVGFLIAIIYYS